MRFYMKYIVKNYSDRIFLARLCRYDNQVSKPKTLFEEKKYLKFGGHGK